MNRIRRMVLGVLLAAAVVVTGALGLAAQEEKVLVVGHAEFTDSLDPARAFSTTAFIVHKATYETLVTFPTDSTEAIVPLLAESWEANADGTVYTFKLRADATFVSGNPVTAADVVFSFNRLKNIKGNAAFLANTIASVEAPDAQTVVLTLTQPDPTILARLVNTTFSVTEASAIQAQGGTDAADADTTDTAESWLNGTSVGSGPYVLERWELQVETVLVRNPNYWGEAPYFDRVIIKNLPEAASQVIELKAGDIDLALDLTPDQVPSLEGTEGVAVYGATTSNLHFLTFNTNPEVSGPLADPTVQLAIRYALDYPGYQAIWGGVTPASIIPVGFLGGYGTDKAFTRDVEQAKALLAEAGYADGFEAELTYPDWTYAGVNWATNAQKIQADLAEVGIQVKLNPQDVSVAFESYRGGTQAFGYWFWHPDYIDPGNHLVFLPEQTLGLRMNWTNANSDATIQELRDRALVETDVATRVEIFQQIQDYLQQSGPWAPFLQNGVQVGYKANVVGSVYHPQWILDVNQLSRAE
ncbi:MAG: ABC transporter substrate-binding protein [Anaerolineae bacterium]|nr:ABC transporter substrate-binding protein [Anaerolineae bacterium]